MMIIECRRYTRKLSKLFQLKSTIRVHGSYVCAFSTYMNIHSDEHHYGSVRKEWRKYFSPLKAFPSIHDVVLEAAAFFTNPEQLDFYYPRDFKDKFKISMEKPIGEGAFGIVRRVQARDCHANLDLAVKIIPKQRVVNQKDFLSLKQEEKMMSLLGGTLNVAHFYGAYEDSSNVYFVMEHCVGGDAYRKFKELGPQQENLAARYILDILHVVWQCHLLKILHGDLKLENFLFADNHLDSPLKLTDFGGAAFLHDVSFLKGVRGTPLYTAPEVLHTKYSFPADMWSCGVILYRLLSGRFPFEGDLLDERIRYEDVDFESPPWTKISPEAKHLTQKLLDRDENARLTAEQALQHPFITENMTSSSKLIAAHAVLGDTMIQRLQFYRSLNGFQQLVLTQIVKTLPLQSKAELIVLFSEISGQTIGICFENFSKAMKNAGYKLTKGEIKNFFSRLDINQDGRIDVDEFCAAFLDWYTIQLGTQWETSLKGTFESLDLDGDGKLTLGDVHRVLTKSVSHSYLTDAARCFQAADRDMKGFICFQDFRAILNIRENAWKYFPKRVY